MKKKVALLLAFVMVLSLLPENVFGAIQPVIRTLEPQSLHVDVNMALIPAEIRTQLANGTLDLMFRLTGAGFGSTATPSAVSAGGLLTERRGVYTPITLTGDGAPVASFSDMVVRLAANASVPASGVSFTFTNVIVQNAGLSIFYYDPVTNNIYPAPAGLSNLLIPFTGAGQGVTIQHGIVRNPLSEPRPFPSSFSVTVQASQLHTTHTLAGEAPTARLSFSLTGATSGANAVRFAHPTTTLATAGDAPVSYGTPRVRVHPDSQIFDTITNERIYDAWRLFSSAGPGHPYDGMLMMGTPFGNGQNVEGWLSFSNVAQSMLTTQVQNDRVDPGNPTNNIPRIAGISGVLVLEIENIAANTADSRITVNRVGRFGAAAIEEVVTLVPNQIIAFGTLPHGVDITSRGPATGVPFVSGLMVPNIRIEERRPQSLHWGWTSGDQGGTFNPDPARPGFGGTVTQFVRLLGPRDYVWNLGIAGGAAGLQPVDPFRVYQIGDPFGALVDNRLDARVVGTYINPPDGRPALVIAIDIPLRGAFPRNEQRASIEIRNLALVPTRDDVPQGNVNIDVNFGHPGGVVGEWSGGVWVPLPLTDVGYIPTVAEMEIIMNPNFVNRHRTVPPVIAPESVTSNEVAVRDHGILALRVGGRTSAGINELFGIPVGTETQAQADVRVREAARLASPPYPATIRRHVWDSIRWMQQGGQWGEQTYAWTNRSTNWGNNLLVGNRTVASLEMYVYNDDIPELISGRRQFPLPDSAGNAWLHTGNYPSTDNANNNQFTNTRTGRVVLRELVPGALDSGWANSVVEFGINPPEGVQIMHAAWRIWAPDAHSASRSSGQGRGWQHVRMLGDDEHPAWGLEGVPTLTPTSLRLFVPRNQDVRAMRTLEIYFYVSIIAGFEHLYDGEDISVTVSGNAVQALDMANRTEVIATVVDPITVHLDGDPVLIGVGQVMSPFELTPIPDIVIQETAARRLTRGTTFTIGVEALPIPVLGNHALVDTRWIPDDSGLELRTTRVGTGQTAYVRFEVIRESHTPATIRLTDNKVIGTFLPAIQYGISINGTPVAAWPTPANIQQNSIAQNTARGLGGLGNFDEIPYFVEIVAFDYFHYPGLPPGIGDEVAPWTPPAQLPITRDRLVLREGMAPLTALDGSVVAEPVILHQFVPGYVTTAMNARIFADFIGADVTFDAGVVTITGQDSNRNPVTVVMTVGSPTATVNGRSIDIAEGSGHGGHAGRISPVIVRDRSFVPARFLANQFLVPISFEAGTITLG